MSNIEVKGVLLPDHVKPYIFDVYKNDYNNGKAEAPLFFCIAFFLPFVLGLYFIFSIRGAIYYSFWLCSFVYFQYRITKIGIYNLLYKRYRKKINNNFLVKIGNEFFKDSLFNGFPDLVEDCKYLIYINEKIINSNESRNYSFSGDEDFLIIDLPKEENNYQYVGYLFSSNREEFTKKEGFKSYLKRLKYCLQNYEHSLTLQRANKESWLDKTKETE